MIITHSIYSPTNPSEGDWWETGTALFMFEDGNWKMMSNVDYTSLEYFDIVHDHIGAKSDDHVDSSYDRAMKGV